MYTELQQSIFFYVVMFIVYCIGLRANMICY